jgi:hypothetical protein
LLRHLEKARRQQKNQLDTLTPLKRDTPAPVPPPAPLARQKPIYCLAV